MEQTTGNEFRDEVAYVRRLAAELESRECPHCSGRKDRQCTFCRRCYYRLPTSLRSPLYKRIGEGYEQAYEAAREFLKG